jgi:hypothetical protein
MSNEWTQGFVPIASNGGSEWYGYDSRAVPPVFLLMPMIGTEWGVAMFLSDTWSGLVEALKAGKLFDKLYQRNDNNVGGK